MIYHQIGTATTVTLTSTDPEGLPLTWSSSVSGVTQAATVTNVDNVFTITPSTNEDHEGTLSVTFSVTDGNNTETSVSSFTLAFLSPYWDETLLSIGTSSTNGLGNSTFIDRSTNAHTVTSTGSPLQTAFHPYLDNWSVKFDGDGDYLQLPSDAGFSFGTGDFTVECWVYYPSISNAERMIIDSRPTSTNGSYWLFATGNTGIINFVTMTTGGNTVSDTVARPDQWVHYAATRSGTSLRLFANGTLVASTTDSSNISSASPTIGKNAFGSSGTWWLGDISNLRIVKGTAVYTSNFTPSTTPLTDVSGTSLLTCQSNRFVDNSSNAHAITPAGNVEISAFNPFGQEFEYAVGNNKGAVEFSGDEYLSVPTDSSLQFGTGDFTIEFWLYFISRDTNGSSLITNYNSYTSGSLAIFAGHSSSSSTKYQVAYNGSSFPNIVSTSNIIYNAWQHIALVRNSGTITLYINGVSEGTISGATASLNGVGSNWGIGTALDIVTTYSTIGSMADLRIVKGTAVYTTNFTPPTAPVGNTNASLYLPMDNAGIFDKTGNHTLTLDGNPGPVTSTTQTKYADTAIGFDGGNWVYNGDGIHLSQSAFTIEGWVYSPAINDDTIFTFNTKSNGDNVLLFIPNDGLYYGGTSKFATGSWSSNVWAHFAITYDGTNLKIFKDGTLLQTHSHTFTTSFEDCVFALGAEFDAANGGGVGNYIANGSHIENFQLINYNKYTASFTVPNRTQGRTYQEES